SLPNKLLGSSGLILVNTPKSADDNFGISVSVGKASENILLSARYRVKKVRLSISFVQLEIISEDSRYAGATIVSRPMIRNKMVIPTTPIMSFLYINEIFLLQKCLLKKFMAPPSVCFERLIHSMKHI